MSAHFDDLISLTSDFKRLTEELLCAYQELNDVIEREHEAIKTGKVSAVEGVVQDKEFATNLLTGVVAQIQKTGDSIVLVFELITGKSISVERSLSGYCEILRNFSDEFHGESGFANQVFVHVFEGLNSNVSNLLEAHRKMQPKVEMNRYLVKTMLSQHQQNYQFWQEVASEAESVYTKKGKRRSDQGSGILKVRA